MIGNDITYAAELLKSGKTVAIPTETVYGLAANGFDEDAVINIFEIKQRPRFNPLILHIGNWEMLETISNQVPEVLLSLAKAFWPGPLTILVPKTEAVHDIITAGSPLVAVRMPNHPLTLSLLQQLPFPLAAPSANTFGTISPTNAQHVENQLGSALDYILDGGECAIGVESTIAKVNEFGRVVILRPGGISAGEMEKVIGYQPESVSAEHPTEAPGMLKSHYAPKIPLVIGNLNQLCEEHHNKAIGIVSLQHSISHPAIIHQEILTEDGDLHLAARNLFAALRRLETSGAEIILGELVPENGIGIAINDRLTRASA